VSLHAEELTLEKAKEIALNNNPELLAQQQAKESANWEAKNALMGFAPSANLSGNYTKFEPPYPPMAPGAGEQEDSKSYGFSINQPIFNGGKIWYGYKMQKDAAHIADYNLQSQILSTIADVESKYFSVLENKRLLQIAQKDLEASRKHLEIAKVRYDTGTLSKGDYLNMQSQTASKEVTLIQMQNYYEISKIDLANFLQVAPDFTLNEVNVESYTSQLEDIQSMSVEEIETLKKKVIQTGLEENPTLKIAGKSTEMNAKAVKIAKGNFLPSVNLSYSQQWTKTNLEDSYDDQGTLTLNASLPIFPIYDDYANLNQTKHTLRESRYDYQSAEDGIRLVIERSLYNLISSAKSVYASEKALEFARETYHQMEVRFQNNLITSADMTDAEVLLTTSENQYTTAFYNFLRAKSSLMQQMGIQNENKFWSLIE
jgi:outer membrane protein TolC